MTREEALKKIEEMKTFKPLTEQMCAEATMAYWRGRTRRFETVDDIPDIPLFNEGKVPRAKEYMEEIHRKMIELGGHSQGQARGRARLSRGLP